MEIARRHFISLLGSAAVALPRAAAAQQLPVVGFLHSALVESYAPNATGFARGLGEGRFVEAQNLAIEYRFANGQLDQLEALAADLVSHSPAVIVAGGAAAAIAPKAATATIPIVIVSGYDPVKLGLAASLNRPGGNVTGVAFATAGLMSKKLDFLRALVPDATTIGYLAEDGRTYAPGSPIARAIFDLKSEMLAIAGTSGGRRRGGRQRPRLWYRVRYLGRTSCRRADRRSRPRSMANDAEEIVALAERNAIPTMLRTSRGCRCRRFDELRRQPKRRLGARAVSMSPRFSRAPSRPSCG